MWGFVSFIAALLIIVLCLFAIYVLYFCFRGGIKEEIETRSIGGRVLDKTAWGINGLACLWIVLRHRHRLWRLVELSEAGDFDEHAQRYDDSGHVITLHEGMVVVSHVFDDPKTLYIRRPFHFLSQDWMEYTKFRRDDLKIT